MKRYPGENERLIRDGDTQLRAPDGTPLPNVPKFRIVPADDPAAINSVQLPEGTCLEEIGLIAYRSEDGSFLPPDVYYRITDSIAMNAKTGLTKEEEKPCDIFANALLPNFKAYMDGIKALGRKERRTTNEN